VVVAPPDGLLRAVAEDHPADHVPFFAESRQDMAFPRGGHVCEFPRIAQKGRAFRIGYELSRQDGEALQPFPVRRFHRRLIAGFRSGNRFRALRVDFVLDDG